MLFKAEIAEFLEKILFFFLAKVPKQVARPFRQDPRDAFNAGKHKTTLKQEALALSKIQAVLEFLVHLVDERNLSRHCNRKSKKEVIDI